MTETHICPRCGWNCAHDSSVPPPTKIENWPEHLPEPPPLPADAAQHHKLGICLSPFEIGEKLYWDLDGADPDTPPLLVMFKELEQIECANYELKDNKWIRRTPPRAFSATVRALPEGTFECHKSIFGDLLEQDMVVTISSLTKAEEWPVYEIA